jgi:hypothetical protein
MKMAVVLCVVCRAVWDKLIDVSEAISASVIKPMTDATLRMGAAGTSEKSVNF